MKPRALRSAGFTLIELLAVLLILTILVAVLVINLRDVQGATEVQVTKQLLTKVGAAIDNYANENGGAPPSSFQAGQEVGNDGTNVGIEALIVTLFSKKFEAGGLLNDVRDQLINSDGDRSTKQLTDFDSRELLEIADQWNNPIAYIERSDYGASNRAYLTTDTETQEQVRSVPVAYKNPTTGQYYAAQGFQLLSAGPDGRFGTEDDITSFERE